ncbi:UTP--glucose-1-phosphate uridylyltransferase [uncultured Tateyamaria sp.]|uniref:UTP--glucose-1-phosphate uridylyltransferase n=1 Tax=uncultured Tateyamaria sp. TaxID=455651 RepID=UPI00261F6DB7|nr:UTP--glucose-1-phosphate uridylyltransferase [uncultured Tateyamaria sp.]
MISPVRTAIFPVAGLGTRFLPATKATPKELLPVIDTPLIQYAIDEAQEAGIERMIFVSHPSKSAIERHVMDDAKLRADLKARGKPQLARDLQEASFCPQTDDVVFTMQHDPLGLGHAVLCARDFVLPGPVAVLLPDDLILGQGCLAEMVAAYQECAAGHMVAAMQVRPEDTRKYGILSTTGRQAGQMIKADGIVEKPSPDVAPSCEAVVGRYVLDASIFDDLANQDPGAGGEIQLTDAISRGIDRVGLAGFRFSGHRYDCGSKAGMLRAILHLATHDPEYHDVLEEHGLRQSSAKAA